MIEYIIKTDSSESSFKEKKRAFEIYHSLCEMHPKNNFKIIKKEVIEEIIAESDDFRQQKFDFFV